MTEDKTKAIQAFLRSVGRGDPVLEMAKGAVDELLKDNQVRYRLAVQASIMHKIYRMANLIGMINKSDDILLRDAGLRLEFMEDKELIGFFREVNKQYDTTIDMVSKYSADATSGQQAQGDTVTNVLVNIGDETKVLTREEELKQVQVRSTVRKVIGGLLDQVEDLRKANKVKETEKERNEREAITPIN